MVTASELREGMALRIDQEIYRVIQVESHAGAAKMAGTVRARLANVHSGRLRDQHFRLLERLEDVELEKCKVEFLHSEDGICFFQRLDSFESVEFSSASLGFNEELLQHGIKVLAEFCDGEPISIFFSDTTESRVTGILTPARSQRDSGRNEAMLENGMTIQVPLSVVPGEIVSVDLESGRYVKRSRRRLKSRVRPDPKGREAD